MKKDSVVALAVVLIVAGVSWGLASVRPDLPNRASEPFRPKAKAGKKVIGPKDKVIMHVNGEPITEAEFNSFAMSAPAESRGFYATEEGRRMLADELVKLKALEQEGRRLGVAEEPEVQAQMNSLTAQIVAGRTLERLVKENIDQRLKAEYEKEKATAKTLRHILVAYQGGAIPPKSGGQPPSAEQAMQKAEALARRIRSGADFGQVAQQESDDAQTSERGGTLGPFQPQQLPPNIAASVNKLQPRQVSDPVRTEYGIHLFMIDSPSIEDLRPMLTQRVQREVLEETVNRLQKSAKVELNKDFFPDPPAQAPGQPKTSG